MPQARYEAWRHLVAAVFEPTPPSGAFGTDISASARSVHFGASVVIRAASDSQHFTRSPRLIAREGLDHYLVQVYRRGTCDGSYGEVTNSVRPGDIKLIDLARPFRSLNTAFENTTLIIPRTALAPLLENPDGLHGLVLRGETMLAQVLAAHINALAEAPDSGSSDSPALISAATVRLVAACLGANPRRRDETAAPFAGAIGQSIRAFIERDITNPDLRPDDLQRHFRVSRSQLYRLFTGDGGIAGYIQSRRLYHCYRALQDPLQARRWIGDIALSFGFSSEAHFSRAFRRAFGVTPSEARAGAGTIASPHATFISDWVRGLNASAGMPLG